MPETQTLGVTAALGSAASWAVGAFLFKSLGEVLSPLALTLAKGMCSLLFLGIAVLVFGIEPLAWQPLLLLAFSGVLGIALGDTFFFKALQGLGPQPLLVLAVFGQVLTALLGVAFLGEQLTTRGWLGIALVTLGVVVVLQATLVPGEQQETRVEGIFYGLLSAVCFSFSYLVLKVALGEPTGTLSEKMRITIQATFLRMLAGTIGVFAFGMGTGQVRGWLRPFQDVRLLLLFTVAVCVVTFGGFWLGTVAFHLSTMALASTLTSTEPIFALILAACFLGEKIALRAVAGTALAVLGVGVLSAS